MFFGLTNSPATFQTMMNTIFRDLIDEGSITIYMDDITIHTGPRPGESEDDHTLCHRTLVRQVLERLRANDLHLNPEKCVFEQDHLDFLGVRIGGGTVQMEQSKVDQVSEWTHPRNVHEVRKFLGFTVSPPLPSPLRRQGSNGPTRGILIQCVLNQLRLRYPDDS